MYGLVNRAVEDLVKEVKGDDGWRRVCAHARLGQDGFIAVRSYPDEVTHRLVDSVSHEMAVPAEQVLEAFGEYWILYTAEQGYGDLLRSAGSDLREVLGHLNHMHGRIETAFPEMSLPYFFVEDIDEGVFDLVYESSREGLAPMVVGLVRGLARRFGQQVEIEHTDRRAPGRPRDRFRVRVIAPAAA